MTTKTILKEQKVEGRDEDGNMETTRVVLRRNPEWTPDLRDECFYYLVEVFTNDDENASDSGEFDAMDEAKECFKDFAQTARDRYDEIANDRQNNLIDSLESARDEYTLDHTPERESLSTLIQLIQAGRSEDVLKALKALKALKSVKS